MRLLILVAGLILAACNDPRDTVETAEPEAREVEDDSLYETARSPMQKAEDVEIKVDDGKKRMDEAIEASE